MRRPAPPPEGNGIERVLFSDGVADSKGGASEDVTCYLAAPSIFLSARLRSQISRKRVKESGGLGRCARARVFGMASVRPRVESVGLDMGWEMKACKWCRVRWRDGEACVRDNICLSSCKASMPPVGGIAVQ